MLHPQLLIYCAYVLPFSRACGRVEIFEISFIRLPVWLWYSESPESPASQRLAVHVDVVIITVDQCAVLSFSSQNNIFNTLPVARLPLHRKG